LDGEFKTAIEFLTDAGVGLFCLIRGRELVPGIDYDYTGVKIHYFLDERHLVFLGALKKTKNPAGQQGVCINSRHG
jgi:hypothetical protein